MRAASDWGWWEVRQQVETQGSGQHQGHALYATRGHAGPRAQARPACPFVP